MRAEKPDVEPIAQQWRHRLPKRIGDLLHRLAGRVAQREMGNAERRRLRRRPVDHQLLAQRTVFVAKPAQMLFDRLLLGAHG